MNNRPNIVQQCYWIIIKPHVLFRHVKEKPMILLPILLMILAGIITGIMAFQVSKAIDLSQLSSISPQQAELTKQMMQNPIMGAVTVMSTIAVSVFGLFFKALILWGVLYMLGGRGKYLQSVSVVGLAWLPLFARNILQAFTSGSTSANQALSAIVNTSFIDLLKSTIMKESVVFILLNIILLVIGYSIVFKISKVKVALTVVLYWLIGLVFVVGTGWISLQSINKLKGFTPSK